MPQGLQAWDASGQLVLDLADRIGRVIYAGPCNASGIPNQVWTSVGLPAGYAGLLWGIMIPKYSLDSTVSKELYLHQGSVQTDPVNHPGAIFINGTWYDPSTSVVTTYPYDNSTLVYGVY